MLLRLRQRIARARGRRIADPPIRLRDVQYCGCAPGHVGTDADLADVLAEYERSGEWIAEPKVDGVWVQVDQHGARSRTGRPVDVPALPFAPCTVVGEYVARSGTVYLFDILTHGPLDCRPAPRAMRSATLALLFTTGAFPDTYRPLRQYGDDFAGRFPGMAEGYVLKRKDDGAYRTGRNPAWIKMKRARTYDAVVTGFVPGASGFAGALTLAQYGPAGMLEDCGKVAVAGQLAREIGASVDAWRGAVVELSAFAQYTTGAFRSPVLIRRRTDKAPADCVRQ